ncbi:MAG: hypothetical protein COZ18_11265 [Flexibacter sp. CG_4_10_14_3_um_filter_32_15]|nr:MAG: hypothetical protein COZ18_11265 [Flexibacter sp. CG_4_10_14_3_um_filter_32_15]
MVQFFRYIANSKFLVVLLPTTIFVGLFVFLKFFFVLFSDRHQLKVSTPSEKIVSTIRNIGKKKDSVNKIKQDSLTKQDNYYDSKESYNIEATKKDTTLRKTRINQIDY